MAVRCFQEISDTLAQVLGTSQHIGRLLFWQVIADSLQSAGQFLQIVYPVETRTVFLTQSSFVCLVSLLTSHQWISGGDQYSSRGNVGC